VASIALDTAPKRVQGQMIDHLRKNKLAGIHEPDPPRVPWEDGKERFSGSSR
jgi:hypothetical protein